MPFRRFLFTIALIAAIAAIGLSLYRDHAADQARTALETWAGDKRAQGWRIDWTAAETAGFPFKVELVLKDVVATTPAGLHGQAEHLRVWSWLHSPTVLHARADAGLSIGYPQDAPIVTAHMGQAGLRATAKGVDFHAHRLNVNHASIADLAVSLDRFDGTARRFAATARDAVLPAPHAPFRISMAESAGRIVGEIPDLAVAAALAAWSRNGGAVEIDRIALDWPPVGLEGDGTAALDGDGQALAAFSLRLRGAPVLLDRLAQAGLMRPAQAAAAGLAAALTAKPDEKGRATVSLPLTVQDYGVFLGPVRIADFPAVPWADFAGR